MTLAVRIVDMVGRPDCRRKKGRFGRGDDVTQILGPRLAIQRHSVTQKRACDGNVTLVTEKNPSSQQSSPSEPRARPICDVCDDVTENHPLSSHAYARRHTHMEERRGYGIVTSSRHHFGPTPRPLCEQRNQKSLRHNRHAPSPCTNRANFWTDTKIVVTPRNHSQFLTTLVDQSHFETQRAEIETAVGFPRPTIQCQMAHTRRPTDA